MVGGALTVTLVLEDALVPQPLDAVTDIDPEADPKVTFMLVVPCPEVMVEPVGTVHVYVDAPVTALIEYAPLVPVQELPAPLIEPGAAGAVVFTVTLIV